MIVQRTAKDTLTALELNHGDVVQFRRVSGESIAIEVLDSGAEIVHSNLMTPGIEVAGATTTYRFFGEFRINRRTVRLEREVGTQKSFYEPWVIDGVRIWLDAVDAIFSFMHETHAPCRPQANCMHGLPERRQVRLALQDDSLRICPERVHPWCPLPDGGLRIEDCYRGEDCWLGAYDGASAHGGLDINHPAGTPLFAPIAVDHQFLYNSTQRGANNNRWRATRHWLNGAVWSLTTCHMVRQLMPEHVALSAGQHYAEGAGVWVGAAEHTHFAFSVLEFGELIHLDPWILFWQMYRDAAHHLAPEESDVPLQA